MKTIKSLLLTAAMTVALTNCGVDPEAYEAAKRSEERAAAAEKEQAEETSEETAPSTEVVETTPETPEATEPTVSVEVDVSVSVEVNTASQEQSDVTLIRRGLTMDQVSEILGEPDNSDLTVGMINWYYYNSPACSTDYDKCSVWFDKDKKVRGLHAVDGKYRDHRDY